MPISKEEKQGYIDKFGKGSNDTGSSEVQTAILTHRIRELTSHVEVHKKDHPHVVAWFSLLQKEKNF